MDKQLCKIWLAVSLKKQEFFVAGQFFKTVSPI